MYTRLDCDCFNDTYTLFMRDGRELGYKEADGRLHLSAIRICELRGYHFVPVVFSRSKGYRYWNKYFAGKNIDQLPMAIRRACEIPGHEESYKVVIIYDDGVIITGLK